MYYAVWGGTYIYIKDALLLIRKSSPCSDGSRFPISLYEWSFTICPTPNKKYVECIVILCQIL